MPNPVSAPSSSYYDPHAQLTPADGADSAAATCEVTPSREVNLPPVTITGDAGAKQLVQRHDVARQQATCTVEGATAALSCGKAGLVAAAGVLVSATTVVGTALAAASALAEGISCGRDLRAYYDCKTQ